MLPLRCRYFFRHHVALILMLPPPLIIAADADYRASRQLMPMPLPAADATPIAV